MTLAPYYRIFTTYCHCFFVFRYIGVEGCSSSPASMAFYKTRYENPTAPFSWRFPLNFWPFALHWLLHPHVSTRLLHYVPDSTSINNLIILLNTAYMIKSITYFNNFIAYVIASGSWHYVTSRRAMWPRPCEAHLQL